MARTNNLTNFLTDVASAIKTKTGDSTAIPASQFDTKIANITTGHLDNTEYTEANDDLDDILEGTASINSLKSLNDTINTTILNFNNFLNEKINEYPVYTSNAVTLYTPDINCQLYIIHKKSNGKYRVVWGKTFISIISNASFGFKIPILKTIYQANAKFSSINNVIEISEYSGAMISSYYSNEFDTPADVINAMSSQTSNITYTKWTSGNTYTSALDNPYLITYTNTNVFDGRNSNLDLLLSQKISANETIEVKST